VRYINIDELESRLPSGWEERAENALQQLRAFSPGKQRTQFIDNHSSLWVELKPLLEGLSYQKCWYSESRNVGSDNAVDHFRPKNRVAEIKDGSVQDGYWWLAFSWNNLRFSCTFCNSLRTHPATAEVGGKQDHFPLLDERKRVFSEGDDLSLEEPELLDPTSTSDTSMIWFSQDGNAVPKYSDDQSMVQPVGLKPEIPVKKDSGG